MYLAIKHIHLTAIVLSISFFLLRAFWVFIKPKMMEKRWVKIAPHIIDTTLLVSAIALAVLLQKYPFVDHWLTAKLLALCLYIVLGTIALKRGKTPLIKLAALFGATATFAYILAVAITHSPIPWG
ncbi:SirB2 family protein [Neptuniibacter pectenicola]|jgi:uncharacterized membrane protein SirB2|uniref:SirB2 family protein n=1 Tax=Neptuniibacter pectenicola TaxID=1806669 RepID=A0ABU9TSM5_9GAMM|nr:SirB2 family protein [Neptuniibacter pectenicola]KXJ55030.1 MAG: regulator SirB [Neptuniibacter sp. Phe_28]|tara:strand:- start:1523 stop:1900 length:378 start_codon:yes stop_codon:yes gene_type:complete